MSLIIPIHNVEAYLAECLDSVLAQTHQNLQVIIVDDGSPDGSYEIARSYAARDSRITIIRQENRGLGAARNAGLPHVTGRFLTFVDSDDTLPPHAIATLLSSLQQTGSHFAVGTACRMDSQRRWTPEWAREVHHVDRLGIALDDFPGVLKDVFAWNKLFVTDFFRESVGQFPEGIRYEDQEPTARAYTAGTFDVLKSVVYNWRMREDGSSITQQKANPDDLADRLIVKNRVAGVMADGASTHAYRSWLAKAIGFDLRSYYEQVPRTGNDYWTQLQAGVTALAERLDDDIWNSIPMIERLPALATVANSRADVISVVTRREQYGWRLPSEINDGVPVLSRRYVQELEFRPEPTVLRLSENDLRLVAVLTRAQWQFNQLRIEGYAYANGIDLDDNPSDIQIEAVSASSGQSVQLHLERWNNPRIDVESGDAWNSYSAAAFSATIDRTALENEPFSEAWFLRVTVTTGGTTKVGEFRDRDLRGSLAELPVGQETDKGRWVVGFEPDHGLTLRHLGGDHVHLRAFDGDGLLSLITVAGQDASMMHLECKSLGTKLDVQGSPTPDGDTLFGVVLPNLSHNSKKSGEEHIWTIKLTTAASKKQRRMVWPGDREALEAISPLHLRVRAGISRAGTVRLHQNQWWASVTQVAVSAGTELVVEGNLSAPPGYGFAGRLANGTVSLPASLDFDSKPGAFKASISLVDPLTLEAAAGQGFSFRLGRIPANGNTVERWIPVAPDLQESFPFDAGNDRIAMTMTRTKQAGALWVKFRTPYQSDERGRLAQRRLHDTFAAHGAGEESGLKHAVLFESFNGRDATDSVRAISEELSGRRLDLALYWTVRDPSIRVPEGATALLIHSKEWIEVLHSAKYLVNNNNFPFYFRKRPEQVYIQTWHGTPLKRIGNDVPLANLSLSYRELMQREVNYWDYLLVQNDYASHVIPKAFDYSGEVVNVGYPRNDQLLAPNANLRRAAVREQLGIGQSETVVLYAPTWRDTKKNSTGSYQFIQYIDFEAAIQRLGKSYRFLLRGHANTARQKGPSPNTYVDVTGYQNINDLYLAADILVTDYSSVMFDFCLTGKPIMFLTPDLSQYRSTVRGFYFDFESDAPGPIYQTSRELIQGLADPSGVHSSYSDKYARFVEKFASSDDGKAAERVVNHIWGQ